MIYRGVLQLFIVSGLFLTACSSTRKNTAINDTHTAFQKNYCAPIVPYEQNSTNWIENRIADLSGTQMSEHNQTLYKILALTQPVAALYDLKGNFGSERVLDKIVLRQKISAKIVSAQSQIAAVSAELDCEGERSDMAANYLDDLDNKHATRLTVASVIVGALTTVATGIINNNNAEAAVGISGGLISAGLGAMTIKPKGKRVVYIHTRNLLRPIWTDSLSDGYFPYIVWQLLHEKSLSNTGDITLQQSIQNRWKKFNLDNTSDTATVNLLFGSGAAYTADFLHTRSSMINQLQATIRSLNQDLASLIIALNTLE